MSTKQNCKICCPKPILEICTHKIFRVKCINCQKKIAEQNLTQCTSCKTFKVAEFFISKINPETLLKTCSVCRNATRESSLKMVCIHQKQRGRCDACNPERKCEHEIVKERCVSCKGSDVCEHDKVRRKCMICKPMSYLRELVGHRVREALKSNKRRHTLEYLDCSVVQLKQHLESQFKHDMTWENHGALWHIDHIVPVHYQTPTLEEVIGRLHYTNLQPLYVKDNLTKGNRFVG